MLQWQLVFLFLLLEVFICILVVLPLPLSLRRSILESIDSLTKHASVNTILKVVFALLLLLFVDCVRSSMRVEDRVHGHDDSHGHGLPRIDHCEELTRLFRNQRNAYLTGFALFLFLMIYRLKEMMMALVAIERRGSAVVKQADQSQKEYVRLTEEKDRYKTESESARDQLKALQEENTKLKSSEKAIKQQADNQSKEYTRLLQENDELHKVANAKNSQNKKGD